MKKIIFLGSSLAAARAMEEIRKTDKESEITMIADGGDLPYQRHLFGPWVAKEIKEEQVIYRPGDYFKENNIKLLFDKNITRFDFKKKRLVTEEKESFDFNVLVITDTLTAKFPEVKGVQKKGVFCLKRFNKIKDMISFLPMVETVIIQTNDILGILLAAGIRKHNKEVIVVVPADFILSDLMDQGPAQVLTKILDDNGVRIITGNSIVEILGDGDVKAVRLSSGKVLATQVVLYSQVKPDFKMLANSGLALEGALVVNDTFQTNLENVYAVDAACTFGLNQGLDDFEISTLHLSEQGKVIGQSILGSPLTYAAPSRLISLNIFDNSVTLIGRTKNQSGLKEYKEFDPPKNIYKKILMENDLVVGAILINVPDEGQKIRQRIEQRIPLSLADQPETKFLLNI